MKSPIYITGLGVISSIGDNVDQTLDNLRKSRTGVDEIKILHTQLKGTLPLAEIKYTNQELAQISGLETWQTRTAQLSMIAAQEASSSAWFGSQLVQTQNSDLENIKVKQ